MCLGHHEDVGLICTGALWNLDHNVTSGLLQFFGEGKSSLTNVRMRVVHQYQAENSTLSEFPNYSAILCDSGCPYVTNLNITGFGAALFIRNYGDILLRNMNVLNCFSGIVALNSKENSNTEDMFRLEKITVNNSYRGILLVQGNFTFPIQLKDITITHCNSGVSISKTMFTKVEMSELTLDTGVNAISIRTTRGNFERVDLCGSAYNLTYNGSFPAEISHESYNYSGRSPCSMVSFDVVF